MKNCHSCLHKCIQFSNLTFREIDKSFILLKKEVSNVSGDMYGKCGKGKNRRLKHYYKIADIKQPVYDCFEPHPTDVMLDKMIQLTDKMLDLVKGKE